MSTEHSEHAAALNEEKLQGLFGELVEISNPVGVQLSLISGDQQLNFVHGKANAELDIPLTVDTIIQIGSTTKIFNAALVMTLVEEGKVDLEKPVRTYWPDFQVADQTASATITLGQLLSMSAGIDNGSYDDHGVGAEALARYVSSLADLPQPFAPGSGFGYSNAGTSIAGYVAERVAEVGWDDLLSDRLLKPAGLNHAATLERDLLFQRVSVGHAIDPESGKPVVVRPWHITRAQGPAGSTLAMNARDLARFGKLLMNGGTADDGEPVLSSTTVEIMTTPCTPVPTSMATAWGMGPYAFDWSGTTLWGHSGGNRSGTSDLRWIPQLNGVMAVTCNTPESFQRIIKLLYTEIAEEAFGISTPLLEQPVSPPRIDSPERYAGRYSGVGVNLLVEKIDDHSLSMAIESDLMPASTVTLLSLGGDRFFQHQGDEADPLILASDVAFLGDDGKGHAATILPGPFAFGRSP